MLEQIININGQDDCRGGRNDFQTMIAYDKDGKYDKYLNGPSEFTNLSRFQLKHIIEECAKEIGIKDVYSFLNEAQFIIDTIKKSKKETADLALSYDI